MNALLSDLRIACRQFALAPITAATAAVSLGIALGAGTLLFGIVQELLLSPVRGVPAAERMVDVGRTTQGHGFDSLSLPNLRDLDARLESVDALYGHSALPMNLATGDGPIRVAGRLVTGGYFDALRTVPEYGRLLSRRDDRPGAPSPVAVISERMLNERFGGDAGAAVGATLRLNEATVEVVGVTPQGFDHPGIGGQTEIWLPMGLAPAVGRIQGGAMMSRGSRWLMAGARLAENRTLSELGAELETLGAGLRADWPTANREIGWTAAPMRALPPPARAPIRVFVGLLFALVGVVLLIATINVGSLLLARGESRRHEIAMRFVLGAGRGRLLRQLLVETLLLVGLAALLGIGVAHLGNGLLTRIELPAPAPSLNLDLHLSPGVLLFTAAAMVLTTLLAGLVPAWRSTRVQPGRVLAGAGRSVGERASSLRSLLTGSQVACSLVLLVLAGLFIGALQRAGDIDIGYRVQDIHIAEIDLRRLGYEHGQRLALVERYIQAVGAEPGFEGAAAASVVPLSQSRQGLGDFLLEDRAPIEADVTVVAGDFFSVFDIPVRGRAFDSRDREGSEPVAVVNATLAERLAPDGEVIGRVFDYGSPGDSRPVRIVGVTPVARYASLADTGTPFVYLPYAQTPGTRMHLVARNRSGVETVARRLSAIQRQVDPRLLAPEVSELGDVAAISLLPQKIAGTLATSTGLLGCALAAIGLYAMLAQLVAAHAQEIGVRMALGASPGVIRRRTAWVGARPALFGALAGLALAAVAARLLDGFVFGVRGADGIAFIAALSILAAICLVALAQPTIRAARVQPSEALRDE